MLTLSESGSNRSTLDERAARSQPNTMTTTSALFREGVEFVNLRELSRALSLSRETIYHLVQRRALPAYRICRKLLFRKSDVLSLLDRSRNDAPPSSRV
jgi:excisionase family DNA binding protein